MSLIPPEIHVSTPEELIAALDHATGGETIILAAGEYGDLGISPKTLGISAGVYSDTVTIRSADPSDPAVFSSVEVAGGQNIYFSDLKFDFVPEEGDNTRTTVFNVRNWSPADRDAKNITVENSEFIGHPVTDGNGGDPNDPQDVVAHGGNVEGMATGIAFSARGVAGITFSGNEISGFFRGSVITESEDVIFTDNNIHSLRSDGADFAEVRNVLIEGNEIGDMSPWRHVDAQAGGDHADLIQFWTVGTTAPSENIVVRGNLLYVSEGDTSQSIFMRNELVDRGLAGEEMFYRNILIEDNLVYNSDSNATRIGAGVDITIRNNTYIQNLEHDAGSVSVPAIRVELISQNVTIENNVVPRIANQEEMEAQGYVIRNNLLIQSIDPNGENYVGDLFVDPLSGRYSTLADLQALPGGLIQEMGVGAAMTHFDDTPDTLTPLARAFSGEYAGDDNLFMFDASLTADTQGYTGDRVTYLWDFGDGTMASGQVVEHRYDTHGEYSVTLTTIADDGATATNEMRVEIDDPVLFKLGLNAAGVFDASSYGVDISGNGAQYAIVELEDGSNAYRLSNTSTLTLDRAASHLYNHDQFTFSLDLKRDMATDGGGYIMMWLSSMRLTMSDEGVLNFEFWNADEEHFQLLSDTAISDTDWHSVAVSYNAHMQQATIYIDGEAAGQTFMEGFTDVQENWGMQLGYSFKNNFEGLLRDVVLSNASLEQPGQESPAHLVPPLPEAPVAPEAPVVDSYIQLAEGGDIQGGTNGNDHITGTHGDDIVKGHDGDDVFVMLDGNDIVNAGGGDDLIYGGAGNDELRGFSGHDTIWGGEGDDLIYGNVIYGEGGADRLRGGKSDDYLSGGTGADRLIADDGNDILIGGAGADLMKGGAGNDLLVADMEDRRLDGGDGIDTLLFHGAADTFDFADRVVFGVEEMDFTNALGNTVVLRDTAHILQSSTDELLIRGDEGDTVQISIPLAHAGTETRDGLEYDVYSDGTATLLLETDLTVEWLA